MNRAIETLLLQREREGRAFTDDELRAWVELVGDSVGKTRAYQEAREHIRPIVADAVQHLHKHYALLKEHQESTGKTERDIVLTVFMAGDSMLLNDVGYARDNLTHWARTVLQAFEFPPRLSRPGQQRAGGVPRPAPAVEKRGLFGMGAKAAPPPPKPQTNPGQPASFDDKIGTFVLSQNLMPSVECLYEGHTFIMWKLKERISAEAFQAWEPYLADARDTLCARPEPAYA